MEDERGPSPAGDAGPFLRLVGLDETHPEYVNIIHLNSDPFAFQVVFARYLPELEARPEERERIRAAHLRDGVPAQVVCRLAVSPAALRDMVTVLQEQLATHERQWGPIPTYSLGGGTSRPETEESSGS